MGIENLTGWLGGLGGTMSKSLLPSRYALMLGSALVSDK